MSKGTFFHPKLLVLLISSICFIQEINGLYEDQVGKFDWKKSFVGHVKYAEFQGNNILVGTSENVLACLNGKTGKILWRQVLENSQEQQIRLFHVNKEVITVSGGLNSWSVRGWDPTSGILIWEWVLNSEQVIPTSYWSLHNTELFHVIPVEGSHIEFTSFDLRSGTIKKKLTKVSAPWLNDPSKCTITKNYFVCLANRIEREEIKFINLSSDSLFSSVALDFSNPGDSYISYFPHQTPTVSVIKNNRAKLIHFQPNQIQILPSTYSSKVFNINNDLYELDVNVQKQTLNIIKVNDNGSQGQVDIDYPKGLGAPHILGGQCKEGNCNLLLTTTDQALLLVEIPKGKISWSSEEALSNIVAAEFFELPVSELDASIENEFKTSSDIINMFIHRISTQMTQLSNLIFGSQLLMNNNMLRDDFGLHKIIVVVTKVGKLFAIDTLSGHILWSYRLPHIETFNNMNEENFLLFIQRTSRYSPLPAQCTLIAKDSYTGNSIIFQFDPITGLSAQGIVSLNKKIKQAMLLPFEDENNLKPFITINFDNTVTVYPDYCKNLVEEHLNSIYTYIVEEDSINGYSLVSKSGQIQVYQNWNFNLKPSKFVTISNKPNGERVHSQGRVLPDRSVYYKYVNPNLIAVATIVDDPMHKQVLNIYLIDGITGFIVYGVSHKKARGPLTLVHSENWLIYTYFNEKFRRVELAALELYEGRDQNNSTFFSSYAMSQLPQIQAQSYILPSIPTKITVTLTERGITNKCLLMVLNSGAVMEIPWALVQPRFSDIPCGPEESCYPYMPEIHLQTEAIINYNQTLLKIKGVAVAPAKLESTSHILVYGLDMFYTRVAPSKTFDVLKEDFDHKLIVLVLIGLISASYITKTLASKKALKQLWK